MTDPQIRYAQTSDGVSIAYWTMGDGPPFVYMPSPPWSHVQLEWYIPEVRSGYEWLAKKRRLVRYDNRCSGLSDRYLGDFSPDAQVRDLEAVVDALDLRQFALLGLAHSGPVAITYAARHPDRLSHFLLWSAYARGSDYVRSPQVQAIRGLMEKDWQTYSETTAHAIVGWSAGEAARLFAEYIREDGTRQAILAMLSAAAQYDASPLLAQVRAPTLVLHRRQIPGWTWPSPRKSPRE